MTHIANRIIQPLRRNLVGRAGRRRLAGMVLVIGICGGNLALAAPAPGTVARPPMGWFVAGSKPEFYRAGLDRAAIHEGQPSGYLMSTVPTVAGFGNIMQTILAGEYAGKRIRLRAQVKSQELSDWAGLWMRVDKGKTVMAFDNMQARPIRGTTDWKPYDVVLDVPPDATEISFGALLSGGGKVWINGMSFEAVGKDVALTIDKAPESPKFPAHPVNLDFSKYDHGGTSENAPAQE